MSKSKPERFPVIFLSHGGGPAFFMDWQPADTWTKTINWLENINNTLPRKPEAIIIISGHWEEEEFTVHNGTNPSLLFDYSGFPEHTYKLKYDAPGAPELAKQVQKLLADNGITAGVESKRGWDHGVFIPLKVIYPEDDIPVLQISLKSNLSPADHIKLGRALLPLRDQGVLIIGSGSSYHNMRGFGPNAGLPSKEFDNWLTEVVSTDDQEEREKQLANWANAPSGRSSHPREEHLIPLMVVAGATDAGDKGKQVFSDITMGATTSAFQFG